MKNRNIPYYVAALMLAAGVSTSFVSCVDTDEPDSIVTLRNAKAEEVKAQAAKINAEVTDLLARLELDKSTQALSDKAKELDNAQKEAQNAYNKALNDLDLAAKKAQAERDETAAKALAETELETAKTQAEADLKNALAQLESAKTALTQAQNKAVKDVEAEQLAIDKKKMAVAIETAQFKEWGLQNADGTYQLKGAKDAYVEALDNLSDALKALKKSIAKLEEDNIETITDKIEECEKTIADAQEGKAEFDALCKANDIQKWVTKYAELDKKITENDQNPEYTQLKYDRESLTYDLGKLNEKIEALKEKRDGVHADSPDDFDGLVDELEKNMEKTDEAYHALEDYLKSPLTLDIVKPVNNELKGIFAEFDMEELIDGDEFKMQIGGEDYDGDELPTNEELLDNEQELLNSLKEKLSNGGEGISVLNHVISDLYQSIRKVEEALKELEAAEVTENEDKFIDVVTKDKTGLVAKWEGARTAYMDEDKNHVNEKLATAFIDANAALFGERTFDASTTEDPDDVDVWEITDVDYVDVFGSANPLAVLPATWDAEKEEIDVTPLMAYGFEKESKAREFAKNHLGRYGQYLAIMEKRAVKAEYEEAKAQAQAIYDEIFAQLDAIPTTAAELEKAIEDAFAEDKVAQADLIKQIEDIDAQILEKDEEKTLAETEEDVAKEDGTLIKERKELEDKIAAKDAEEAEKFDVSKEKALRDAILTFGLKLNLFTLDDEGNVKVDADQVEVAYNAEKREDFEKAYQATIDYYDNGIKDAEEQLKDYQEILKAFNDKISGANTAADDKDVNKAIDFDFSSKALKEFFASDDIKKDYAKLIEDVEAKQKTVKEKETALEKAEAEYNFYKKAYGVDNKE